MTIKKKVEKTGPIEIDLTGPQGNVFFLMATAKKYAGQLGFDGAEIVEEMSQSDYENAIQTFDKYFGSFITLYR